MHPFRDFFTGKLLFHYTCSGPLFALLFYPRPLYLALKKFTVLALFSRPVFMYNTNNKKTFTAVPEDVCSREAFRIKEVRYESFSFRSRKERP